MHRVTVKDFPNVSLGDKRRTERLATLLNNISSQPGSSIPKQSQNWYETKAAYEFYSNDSIKLSDLEAAVQIYGSQLIDKEQKTLLIAHDFCQISYTDLKAEGLGYLADEAGRGIITYNSIAISPDGIPLSLLYQQSFIRPLEELGKTKQRKQTAFEDKESYHWYKGISKVNELLGEDVRKIHISDRESDIYELFFFSYQPNTDLLIRARHNRNLKGGSQLWDAVAAERPAGKVTIEIPSPDGKKRKGIKAEVRYRKVEILRPRDSKNEYDSVELTAIELRQVSPLADWQEEPLHWKLLTSVAVSTISDALQCVKWYCLRWLIERFHYVLKSGTKIEELQLQRASSLQRAIYVYSMAAIRILHLVYQSRRRPEISCEVILTREEWSVLYMLIHQTAQLPAQPPTLGQAVLWIGRLGGHLGRKSDGPPGLKAVWLGYQRITDAAIVYDIMNLQNLGKR
jgi:Transposase DNA-binding/Transposase Tn5 dimerisation domain